MRVISHYLFLCLFAAWAAIATHAADAGRTPNTANAGVTVQAILVLASEDPGNSDPALAPYEGELRRFLKFTSYRRLGGGQQSIAASGRGTISLGQGQRLEVQVESATVDAVKVAVRWMSGDRALVPGVTVSGERGTKQILGGPKAPDGKGVYAVLVIAR